MPTAGQPIIACQRCGHEQADVVKMTVSYTTEIDTITKETSHRHASTKYHLKCPKCCHAFSVDKPTNDIP